MGSQGSLMHKGREGWPMLSQKRLATVAQIVKIVYADRRVSDYTGVAVCFVWGCTVADQSGYPCLCHY